MADHKCWKFLQLCVWEISQVLDKGMADYDPLKKVISVPVTLHFSQNVYIGGLGVHKPRGPRRGA